MTTEKRPSSIESASARLRAMSLATEEGSPLGSEDALQAQLGIARSTVRQAARILEREGLLRVKRGASGGYFAARPQMEVIENAVSAYLRTKSIEARDVMVVANLVWPEAVRLAAAKPATPESLEQLSRGQTLVDQARGDMTREEFAVLEKGVSQLIVRLSGSSYIELIFGINSAFFRLEERRSLRISEADIAEWRERRSLELAAIRSGDQELAIFAGRRFREFFHGWVMGADRDQQGA